MNAKSIALLIFLSVLNVQVFAQTENYQSLAYGEWIYDTTDKDFFGKLLLMDDNTFEMTSKRTGKDENVSKGTYIIEDDRLILTFESGKTQNNEIEKLDKNHLQFRYIETVYFYKRANS